MKKLFALLLVVAGVFAMVTVQTIAEDKSIEMSAAFGDSATIEVYADNTGTTLLTSLTIDTSGITFPFVSPTDNDAEVDPHVAAEAFIKVSAGDNEGWAVAIYSMNENPDDSGLVHELYPNPNQRILLKYCDSTDKVCPALTDTITEADWKDPAKWVWTTNLTSAETWAGLDVPTQNFTKFILPNEIDYATTLVELKFAIGLQQTMTASGRHTTKIGFEVVNN